MEVPQDTELLLPCCDGDRALGMPGVALEAVFPSVKLSWQWKSPNFQDRKYIF